MEIFYIALAPLILIHLTFIMAISKKDFSLIDCIWGLGFISLSLVANAFNAFQNTREVLLLVLITLWGLRLSLYIYSRNHGQGEDFRYAQWRKDWGEKANQIAYVKVYLLQFVLMLLVGLPIFAVHQTDTPLVWFDILGAALFLLGFLWEAVADYQKSKFKTRPGNAHKLFQGGLWFYSRHPNYFGEATLWWGLGIIAAGSGHWWALLGSLFINFLLLKVSGVPLLEARHQGKAEWESYKEVTPTLIPNLLKKVTR